MTSSALIGLPSWLALALWTGLLSGPVVWLSLKRLALLQEVAADELNEYKQALVAGPAALRRIEWLPKAERVVIGVPVLGPCPRGGMHAGEVLGSLAVGGVGRLGMEGDADVAPLRVAGDVDVVELVGQFAVGEGVA